MNNQVIRSRYAALTLLAERVLPTKGINKVATLIATRFQKPYEATEIARKSIIAQHPVPDGWDKPHLPTAIAEARQVAMDELMAQATPVRKIPDALRLRSSDLPIKLKREGGESNVEGLAQIRVMLGTLYIPDPEDWGEAEGEEEDDAAPIADDGDGGEEHEEHEEPEA